MNLKSFANASKNVLLEVVIPGAEEVVHVETDDSYHLLSSGGTTCNGVR